MEIEAIVTKVQKILQKIKIQVQKILSSAIITMKDKSCNSKAIVERCKNKNSNLK